MLLLYFLGSYIRKYNLSEKCNKKFLVDVLVVTTVLNVALNSLVSLAAGGKAHIPFARDCSIFIVIEATALMMLFLKIEIHSDIVNKAAKHVFAVYLFEGAFRQFAQKTVLDYSLYENNLYWPLINILVALIAMVGCMAIDVLVQPALKPLRRISLKVVGGIIEKIKVKGV